MSYGYEDVLEIACMDKFHCGLDELKALIPIYSELAELSGVSFKILGCMNDLHVMVEYAYTTIRDSVAESIRSKATNNYIEVVPDDVDSYVKYEVDDVVKAYLTRLADKIERTRPQYEDLTDIKFNSLIDEALDLFSEGFDDYPENVAEHVIQLAYDEGLIKVNKEYKE